MVANVQVSDKLFSEIASEEQIKRTAQALEANGIKTLIAENAEEAKRLFFELVPEVQKFSLALQ
jgi:L-lactate utilization protein LutB